MLCCLSERPYNRIHNRCTSFLPAQLTKVIDKREKRAVLPCGGLSGLNIGDVITWSKGNRIIAAYRVNNVKPTPMLHAIIKNVKEAHVGSYKCTVTSVDVDSRSVVVGDKLDMKHVPASSSTSYRPMLDDSLKTRLFVWSLVLLIQCLLATFY